MKTSSKLLLSFLAIIIILVTVLIRMADNNAADSIRLSGKLVSKTIESEKFSGIDIKGNIKAVVTQGPSNIEVKGDEHIISGSKIYVENDVLHIQNYVSQEHLEVEISSEFYKEITISQGSVVESGNRLKGDNLNLTLSTGSQGTLEVDFKKLKCTASTGAIVNLSGLTEDIYYEISTGAILNSTNLKNKNAKINGSLGSVLEVHVTDYLTAELSTGSVLKYKGSPELKDINTSSGGTITAME